MLISVILHIGFSMDIMYDLFLLLSYDFLSFRNLGAQRLLKIYFSPCKSPVESSTSMLHGLNI